MSNLANIIKNIDPPIELTQTQYNALSTQQKNNGLYYVNNGSGNKQVAATTFAQGRWEQDSNVQTELNNLNNTFDKIINGPLEANTTKYLDATRAQSDDYGNFVHKRNNSSDFFAIINYNETLRPFGVYFQTGQIFSRINGENGENNYYKTLCFGVGNTFNQRYRGAGYVTNSSKGLRITIPIITCATTATITDLKITACHYGGGSIYMKYGNSYVALNSELSIWENSAQVYANSISDISATIRKGTGILISINFVNALVTSNAGTTNVTNMTPAGIYVYPTIVFS